MSTALVKCYPARPDISIPFWSHFLSIWAIIVKDSNVLVFIALFDECVPLMSHVCVLECCLYSWTLI